MDNGVGGIQYIKTPSGIYKILEIIFSLCAFISAMAAEFSWSYSPTLFFNIISLLALLYALLITILSVVNILSNLQMGLKVDLITSICFSILIFSSAALWTMYAKHNASTTAAVVFQYLNGFVFLGSTIHKIISGV